MWNAPQTVPEDAPLVVDLDGTLLRSDLLIESFFSLLSTKPLDALGALFRVAGGKAALKSYLADRAAIDVKTLPFDPAVLAYLRKERDGGRRLYLASASDHRFVGAVAKHLGLFDGAFGSRPGDNLTGPRKAARLCDEFGEKGFDYIGNDWVDLAVWGRCRHPIAANAPARLLRKLRAQSPEAVEIESDQRPSAKTYIRALRVHQWLKNLLVFVPLLAGHQLTVPNIVHSVLAMIAFSLAASSTYLLNDLLDLSNDRDHATKRFRPLASGALPLAHALVIAPLLLIGAVVAGLLIAPSFLVVLGGYYAATVAYSVALKRLMLVDALTLAGLYTIRILAGGRATAVPLSPWLLAFSVFVFLCLALIKRYIELVGRLKKGGGDPRGRGYRLDDLPIISGLASAGGYCSVLVLALYFNSPDVHVLYRHAERLWLLCPLLIYWFSRMLLLAHRGDLHDDPVVFAATDRISLAVGALMAAVVAVAV